MTLPVPWLVLVLAGVGMLAGMVGSVASLASLVSYPALLALGLPPVSANVTNTVALVLSGVGSAAGSRPELAGQGRRVARLGLLTAAGGAAGAALLLATPSQWFTYVAPVLIAAGAVAILRPPASRAAARPGDDAPAPSHVGGSHVGGWHVGGGHVGGWHVRGWHVGGWYQIGWREGGWASRLAVFGVAVYIGTSAQPAGSCCSRCSSGSWPSRWPVRTR